MSTSVTSSNPQIEQPQKGAKIAGFSLWTHSTRVCANVPQGELVFHILRLLRSFAATQGRLWPRSIAQVIKSPIVADFLHREVSGPPLAFKVNV
jgi:hypothetical protein